MTTPVRITFEELLRRNLVPNVEVDLEVLSDNNDLENDPDVFFDNMADRQGGIDVNNLMCAETLTDILTDDIGFSNEAARVLAPEMIYRRISSTRN